MRWIASTVLSVALLTSPLAVLAEEAIPPSPIVKTQLLVDAASAKAGVPIAAGVTFTMPEHWHIYWQNPGDSGIPTRLTWTTPEGITAGDIAWPAPERLTMADLVNYGYSNVVTLPVTLQQNRDGITGEISVKAAWLVCRDICIPESATLTAPLQANSAAAATLSAARAAAPTPFAGTASFATYEKQVTLAITPDAPWGTISDARFSPLDDGIMANYPAGSHAQTDGTLTFTLPRGTADPISAWRGVVHVTADGKTTAWELTATNTQPLAAATADSPAPAMAAPAPTSFIAALLLAFLGGLILNIMPCVLPILALKALALSKKAQASRSAALAQGISYTAGVVASFLLIAGVMLALKATGAAIGWGFQLQNVGFVAFLAAVMLMVSANLLGLFELPVLFGSRATGVNEDKLGGSFFTGVLAVLVATPCTAPFMATAIGTTLSLPPAQALVVFAALGLGMAAPFLLISIWPAARRLLPKPGAWMHRFKQILAIPMLATAAWLLFVLLQLLSPTPMEVRAGHEPYSAARLSELRAAKQPVFVDATAAWCLSCKVNERVALKPAEMQQFFRDRNITMLVADWTASDPAITDYLAQFGRNGVPLYVYYPPDGEPVVLPQVLSPSIVREAIEPAN
jgi:DsbC/DsbD-like thiol-disulfide interchange protein